MPGAIFILLFLVWLVLYPAITIATIVKRAVRRRKSATEPQSVPSHFPAKIAFE